MSPLLEPLLRQIDAKGARDALLAFEVRVLKLWKINN